MTAAFEVRETHGILWRPENKIFRASDGLSWNSLYASMQHEKPYEDAYGAVPDHLIILHLDGPVGVSRIMGNAHARRIIPPGGLFVLPGGADFGVRLEDELDSLHLYVRHAVVREVAGDIVSGDPAHVEILPRLGDQDPLIERLALGIRDALDDPDPSGSVYVDYLARAIAARLIRGHSTATGPQSASASVKGRLTRAQLARATDFIEAHLEKPLTLADLAAATGLSATHFARRFRQTTGTAPHQFLVRARVERAKRLLSQSDLAIAQIAFSCGFAHQEHLTRIFRRCTGATPAAFRRLSRS
jgi:AraC family transcriptional regulator